MYSTYLARIASNAEKACAIVIDRPRDPEVCNRLYEALAPVADATFQGDEPDLAYLFPLFSEARVWAAIVRTRIASLRTSKRGYPAMQAVQFPARDLLPILGELSRELETMIDRSQAASAGRAFAP